MGPRRVHRQNGAQASSSDFILLGTFLPEMRFRIGFILP
jgi:hypothetical protein